MREFGGRGAERDGCSLCVAEASGLLSAQLNDAVLGWCRAQYRGRCSSVRGAVLRCAEQRRARSIEVRQMPHSVVARGTLWQCRRFGSGEQSWPRGHPSSPLRPSVADGRFCGSARVDSPRRGPHYSFPEPPLLAEKRRAEKRSFAAFCPHGTSRRRDPANGPMLPRKSLFPKCLLKCLRMPLMNHLNKI